MLQSSATRTICESLRELYLRILEYKNDDGFKDMEELLKFAYVSAKKMNKQLVKYAKGTEDMHDTEDKWLGQLEEVRREHEDSLR